MTTDGASVSRATIRWISGPVLRAIAEGPFALREAVRVGPSALLGEVVRIDRDEIVVQVYEDTTGFRPGTEVVGTGRPLAIPLGPGLLGNIFDGLLRPLSGTAHVVRRAGIAPCGSRAPSRSRRASSRAMRSHPAPSSVDAAGATTRAQAILAPPDVGGRIVERGRRRRSS